MFFLTKEEYNNSMYNWSTDTTRLQKKPDEYAKFILEQRINFGLNGEKLSLRNLKNTGMT